MSIPTGGIPFPPPVIPVTVPPPGAPYVVSGGMGVKRGHDGGHVTGEPPNKRSVFILTETMKAKILFVNAEI